MILEVYVEGRGLKLDPVKGFVIVTMRITVQWQQ
jgi:hypothetical protein